MDEFSDHFKKFNVMIHYEALQKMAMAKRVNFLFRMSYVKPEPWEEHTTAAILSELRDLTALNTVNSQRAVTSKNPTDLTPQTSPSLSKSLKKRPIALSSNIPKYDVTLICPVQLAHWISWTITSKSPSSLDWNDSGLGHAVWPKTLHWSAALITALGSHIRS